MAFEATRGKVCALKKNDTGFCTFCGTKGHDALKACALRRGLGTPRWLLLIPMFKYHAAYFPLLCCLALTPPPLVSRYYMSSRHKDIIKCSNHRKDFFQLAIPLLLLSPNLKLIYLMSHVCLLAQIQPEPGLRIRQKRGKLKFL
jgi:hypothetical protein